MRAKLIEAARAALQHAYAPYSGYKVGAAVLAGGKIYTGVNVENASYGLSMCAERSAVLAAVTDGAKRVEAVAVAVGRGMPSPCGACRQFLREFGEEMSIYLVGADGEVVDTTLTALLPSSFGPSFLRGE